MAVRPFLIDASLYDINKPVASIDEIRKYNSQRFEMEQLTGILYEDPVANAAVGYKLIRDDEFWVRGHMPGQPLLPGVLMCETAAQLCSYIITKFGLFKGAVMGFAGLEEVKFRGIVQPGDTLVIQGKLLKIKNILVTARFMGIVNDDIVCEGIIKGFPLKPEMFKS